MAICRICNKHKFKYYLGQNKYGWSVYIDPYKREWAGRICPDCINTYHRLRRRKTFSERECVICKKTFKPTRDANKVCPSRRCKVKRHIQTNREALQKRALKKTEQDPIE